MAMHLVQQRLRHRRAGLVVLGVVLASTCGQSAHISLTCDGYSTKSRGTLVPLKYGYFTFENMPCSAWPNSWNIVVTSSHVSSVGWPAGGLGMLRWLATTGRKPVSSDWST